MAVLTAKIGDGPHLGILSEHWTFESYVLSATGESHGEIVFASFLVETAARPSVTRSRNACTNLMLVYAP